MPQDGINLTTVSIKETTKVCSPRKPYQAWNDEHTFLKEFYDEEYVSFLDTEEAPRQDFIRSSRRYITNAQDLPVKNFNTYVRHFLILCSSVVFIVPRFMEELLQVLKKKNRRVLKIVIDPLPLVPLTQTNRGGVTTYFPLGGIAWKKDGAYFPPVWFSYKNNVIVAPHDGVTEYDLLTENAGGYQVTDITEQFWA